MSHCSWVVVMPVVNFTWLVRDCSSGGLFKFVKHGGEHSSGDHDTNMTDGSLLVLLSIALR